MAVSKAMLLPMFILLVPVTAVGVSGKGPGLMRREGAAPSQKATSQMAQIQAHGADMSQKAPTKHECSADDESNCCFTKAAVKFAEDHADKVPKGGTFPFEGMCAYGASQAAPDLWSELVKLLETCTTDACSKQGNVPKVPESGVCKDYTCPEGFNGHTPDSGDRPCETAAMCDFNCCEVDINSDPKRRNGYLTFGIIMSLQNVSKVASQLTQQDNPEAPHTKGPEADVEDLLDKSAGLYHVMHRVMGKEKAKDHCGDGDFSTFRACVHNSLCVIQDYTKANPGADNQEMKTYTMLMEVYEDFKSLTWDLLNKDLLKEGVSALGDFDFVSEDELKKGCDGFNDFLNALKPADLLETGGEEASEVAAAARVSTSLIEAAKTTHAVLDAHTHNSSANGTVTALHQAWMEPCKLLNCDHTNYYDMLGASYTHSLALLDLGMSANHMKVHVVTRSRLEKRMQKFLASHGSKFADELLSIDGTLTEARLSQYSEALLDATKATLTQLPLTYGVDSLLLSMADRSAVLEFAKTPLQEDALDALWHDDFVAYPDANKLREKMNLPPSAVDLDEEFNATEENEDLDLNATEENEDLDLNDSLGEIPHRAALLDRSLQRKGFVKFFESVGKGIAKGVTALGKGIVKVGQAIGNGIVAGFTALGEAIVTVAKGIYAGIKAFVDFVISLFACFGFGTVSKVGYGRNFGKYVALTIAIALSRGLTNILQGKVDYGVGIELSLVAGVCPGGQGVGIRIGFGIGLSLACAQSNGCTLTVSVGVVASAAVPKEKNPRCIMGKGFLGFTCLQAFGIVIKLLCCSLNILTGCTSCGGGGCKSSGTRANSAQKAEYDKAIATKGASAKGCSEALSGNGAGYRGCQTDTRSGRICQKWSVQSPHKHGWINSDSTRWNHGAESKGLGDHNFCRNPDNKATIWCYTMDTKKQWDYCDPGFVVVSVGNSRSNKRCARLHGAKLKCARDAGDRGKRLNQDHASAGDRFEITVEGDNACARRLDNRGGWGMNLQFKCETSLVDGLVPIGQCVAFHAHGGDRRRRRGSTGARFMRMHGSDMDASGEHGANHLPGGWQWEKFTVVDAGNDQIALHSSAFNRFVLMNNHADMGASGNMGANQLPTGWQWERFTVVDAGNRQVALHSKSHNRFIRMGDGGNRRRRGTWMDASKGKGQNDLPTGWRWERFTPVLC